MEALENWQEEKCSSYLYTRLAEVESNPIHKKLFLGLAAMAEKQAAIWEKQLKAVNCPTPTYKPNLRTRIVAFLASYLGPHTTRRILAAMKVRGMSIYLEKTSGNGFAKSDIEKQHGKIKSSGNLRAAVFGVSDGLVSNACLIFGVAGANADHRMILLTGIAGLLAGASSMGAGEYVSVRSQREMLEYQLALEKSELELYPEEEAAELALIYEARGFTKAEATDMADKLIQQPDKALDTLAREELGINPNELGSPWGAAISSFISFSLGAFVPILPFLTNLGRYSLPLSVCLTGIILFAVGAFLSLFTQKNAWWSGLRMFLIGACAAGFTFFVGYLFGVAVH